MKLKFTRKTWYFFLLAAAAASMLNGFAVLSGMDFSFLEMVAFCITGITALVWPALLAVEYRRGNPIQRQLQLVGGAEALHLLLLLMTRYGGLASLSFWTNILWVLLACARGWAALALYKGREDDA